MIFLPLDGGVELSEMRFVCDLRQIRRYEYTMCMYGMWWFSDILFLFIYFSVLIQWNYFLNFVNYFVLTHLMNLEVQIHLVFSNNFIIFKTPSQPIPIYQEPLM